jgi:glutathione peroxidase
MSFHDITFEGLTGGSLPLAAYRGKAVLVVNTASECGYTPQYAGLQKLWAAHKDRGLVVLGVPSNDFGAQEPGTATQIAAFCEKNYGVDFPMTAKVATLGAAAHPFYKRVVAELGEGAAPRWNFHKYLLDGAGALAGAWPSKVAPESKELAKAIEAALPR